MVLLCPLVVIWTCSAFRPRFLYFIFPLCFSPTDLHLYITVTGRVPSLNAPSIFTTFELSRPLSLIFSFHTHSYILKFSSFAPSLSFSPLASSEPNLHHFALPPQFPSIVSTRKCDACVAPAIVEGSRAESFPSPRDAGGLEGGSSFFSYLLTLHTDRWLHYLDSF